MRKPSHDKVLVGKQHAHKGWTCGYLKDVMGNRDYTPTLSKILCKGYLAVSPLGEQYQVTNINVFCRDYGLERSLLWLSANNRSRGLNGIYKGWTFDFLANAKDENKR